MGILETLRKKRKWWFVFLVLVFAITIGLAIQKKMAPVSWMLFETIYHDGDYAISGYDPVAYHTEHVATEGQEQYVYTWNDQKWKFKSPRNLELFSKNPNRYAPQFGGYCAAAVSKGFTAASDSRSWHIMDSKLYLFSRDSKKQKWLKQKNRKMIEQAEENWNE